MLYISIQNLSPDIIRQIFGIFSNPKLVDASQQNTILLEGLIFQNLTQRQAEQYQKRLLGSEKDKFKVETEAASSTRVNLRIWHPSSETLSDFLARLTEVLSSELTDLDPVLRKGFYIRHLTQEVANAVHEKLALVKGIDVELSTDTSAVSIQGQDSAIAFQSTLSQPSTSSDAEKYVVTGQIFQTDGTPVEGVTVQAFDQDLRSQEQLGAPYTTNKDGRYEIHYDATQFAEGEVKTADLFVQIEFNGETIKSPIIFNASKEEVINLTVEGPPKFEYADILEAIYPLITRNGIDLHEVRENEEHKDITFISGDTGIDPDLIRLMVEAEKLNLSTESQHPWCFYALLRQDLPTDLSKLLEQPRETRERALKASRDEKIVDISDDDIKVFLKQLEEIQVKRITESVSLEESDDDSVFIGQLLSINAADRIRRLESHSHIGSDSWGEI